MVLEPIAVNFLPACTTPFAVDTFPAMDISEERTPF